MSTLKTTNIAHPSATGNNIVLDSGGGAAFSQIKGGAITSGTSVASTSGTSINFTGIPSYVKRITVMFSEVSTSGTSSVLTQVGATSIQTTNYRSSSNIFATGVGTVNSTAGFLQHLAGNDSAGAIRNGLITLVSIGSNIWAASGIVGLSNVATTTIIGGSVTLSGTLDRIRITTVNGTDTFDAGTINIMYEG